MMLFGMATTPPLLGIAWAAHQLPSGFRVWLQKLAGLVVAISGVLLILKA